MAVNTKLGWRVLFRTLAGAVFRFVCTSADPTTRRFSLTKPFGVTITIAVYASYYVDMVLYCVHAHTQLNSVMIHQFVSNLWCHFQYGVFQRVILSAMNSNNANLGDPIKSSFT